MERVLAAKPSFPNNLDICFHPDSQFLGPLACSSLLHTWIPIGILIQGASAVIVLPAGFLPQQPTLYDDFHALRREYTRGHSVSLERELLGNGVRDRDGSGRNRPVTEDYNGGMSQ